MITTPKPSGKPVTGHNGTGTPTYQWTNHTTGHTHTVTPGH